MAIYKEVGKALSEETFDWVEADGGWPDVNWLIANYLLSEYDEFSKHRMRDGMVGQIKNCIAFAIGFSEETLGVKIYRGYTDGGNGKKLAFITPDPEYKRAKDQDYLRMMRNCERIIVKSKTDVERRFPEGTGKLFISDIRKIIAK